MGACDFDAKGEERLRIGTREATPREAALLLAADREATGRTTEARTAMTDMAIGRSGGGRKEGREEVKKKSVFFFEIMEAINRSIVFRFFFTSRLSTI